MFVMLVMFKGMLLSKAYYNFIILIINNRTNELNDIIVIQYSTK